VSNWLVKSGFVGETTQYDKKILPDFRKPKSWLKSVSAFANGLGGKLIFGVDDKKQTHIVLEEKDYESFGLIDDKGFLTYAGALLADESPIRHSRVFCTRWNGLDKAGGLIEAWDDMEVSGSLANLFMETMNFIRRNNKMRWKKLASSRANMPEYPERAVQECVINALIHRDYLEIGSEVHVDIFDDRMEIFSPGGMLDGSQIQNLNPMEVRSKRRNPVIADVFNRMGLMERRGSGFRKIIDAYRNAYLYREDLLPRMYSNDVDFCVVLCNLNYGTEKDEVNVIGNESFAAGNESFALIRFLERVKVPNIMSEHIVAVYTRVKEEKVFSRKDIMEWLGFSASSAAGRVINTMKKLDLIEHAEGRGNGKYQFRKDVEGNDSVWLD
jgi:predicted HTH transcriptional regulator